MYKNYKETAEMADSEIVPVIVTVDWLKSALENDGIRIIDGTFHMETTNRDAKAEYEEKHIPGAVYFDINECADKSSDLDLPHMLPDVSVFEEYVASRGISNASHVVIYDNNPQFPVFSSQRVWWTFRVFGHGKVSILEGGLPKWLAEGGPVTNISTKTKKESYKAKLRQELVKSYDDVERNIKTGEYLLVDARPPGRFNGTAPEPIPGVKSGHIPNSCNVPFMPLMDQGNRTYKSPDELKKYFAERGLDLTKPIIFSCGSGLQASNLVLASYLCGKSDAAMYDGSWVEWYRRAPPDLKMDVPTD